MSALEKLKKTTSLSDLANLLGYKPKNLSYILYKIPNEEKYLEFTISKKNGGERRIKAPVEKLKHVQKHLANLLNECFEEICRNKRPLSHGFRKKRSIITNAENHRNKRYVFNVDLQDFFPSINFGRVRGYFIKNAHFALDSKVATIIAQIACHNNELPQGSPCSPVISNLIGHLLDIRMVNLAKKAKCTYSRYADDLTFSTNRNVFPEKISIKKIGNDNEWISGKALKKEIKKVGFTINEEKTSLQYKTARQVTTGLVVNEKVNIKRDYYRQARSMCNSLFQSDEFYIASKHIPGPEIDENTKTSEASSPDSTELPKEVFQPEENIRGSLNQLEGILSFIYYVKKCSDDRKKNEVQKKNDKSEKLIAITSLYGKFLFYKYFFSLDRPLIICEGKTDNIYLKCALRQLEKDYGELVEKKDDGFIFKVGFFRHSKIINDVLKVAQGASGLASLVGNYEKFMKSFKGRGKKHPVIMLLDDDGGSSCIKKLLKRKLTDFNPAEPFTCFVENLYIVFLPSKSGVKETEIEDLFDKETLTTKFEGKTFTRKDKFDLKKEYGKFDFARQVVEAKQETVNFSGFKVR